MSILARFFGGMSWMGYVITFMTTLLLGMSVALAWTNHAKDKAEQELAGSQQAIMQLVETNVHHNKEIDRLIGDVTACANKRASAEKSALETERELHRLSVIVEEATSARTQAIKDEIESAEPGCDCVVPPRATRLLQQAACDANRAEKCP